MERSVDDIVIDENGVSWAIDSPELASYLSTSLRGEQFCAYAVKNLGWIAIRARQSGLQVRCRPSLLSDSAITALLFYVHDWPTPSIALDLLLAERRYFLLRDRRMFVSFFAAVVASEKKSGFWSGPRLLNRLSPPDQSPFRTRAALARQAAEAIEDASELRGLFDRLFTRRWALHTLDTERGHSVIEEIGTTYTPFNPKWLGTARGQTLCGYGDEPYGLWIADMQRLARDNDQTIYDDVDAVVAFPGIGDTRLQYSRMTLPLRRPDGRSLILSTAMSNSNIDLRSLHRKKPS